MYKSLPLVSFPVFPFINMHNWETASYILFSAKTQIYKQNKYTYTQSGGKKSLFQFCLTITEPRFLPSVSRKWKTIEVSAFHAPLVT